MTPDSDRLLGFLIPARSARGRLVRLGPALAEILSAHPYAETPSRLLSEAIALVALMGAMLRPEEGQVTVQAQSGNGGSGGPIRLLVADYLDGALRGYVAVDPDRRIAPDSDLAQLFGDGRLVITLDQTVVSERYQGIVALEGPSLGAAAEAYFRNSEQVPTLVRLAASRGPDGTMRAGGFIVQHLARAEESGPRLHLSDSPDWDHVAALGRTLTDPELLDPDVPLEALLWRLFHQDEVRVLPEVRLSRGCRCSRDYIRSVLLRFPESERVEMRDADGEIRVDCEFCARQFRFAV
jgi:molecular chaperone Hsp33